VRKIIPVVVAGAVAVAASGGTFAYAAADKQITLSVDGKEQTVNTFSRTVGDVLKSRGVAVGAHDEVAPSLDTKLSEGSAVAVRYGRQVTVQVDGEKKSFWTTAQSVGDAMNIVGLNAPGADISTSRSTTIGRRGLSWTVDTVKTVTIKSAGKSRTVKTTAGTVAGALAAAKITVDKDDLVSKKLDATVGQASTITVTDVSTKQVRKTKSIDHDTVEQKTKSLDKGQTQVKVDGHDGTRTYTYKVTLHDGKEHSRTLVSAKVTRQPVDEVVLVGTRKLKPKQTDDSSSSSSSSSGKSDGGSSDNGGSSGDAPAVASGSVWDRIAQCESGGNWHINTGNGFYGGLQFTLSTWHAYGGSGMPNQASREQQIAVAQKVQASQGWGAWPACTSKLGLR
jgi:uncharacterized protein YabE (DUF348 family)